MERVLAMSVPDRIALPLALGHEDLRRFVRTSGLDPATARSRLKAQRQHGRVSSACAGAFEPWPSTRPQAMQDAWKGARR
jgi:hypothetical protein